jgi:hypothetical protein
LRIEALSWIKRYFLLREGRETEPQKDAEIHERFMAPNSMRPLQRLTIFVTLKKRMGFSEVTGGS